MYAGPHLRLMRLRVKSKRMMQLVLLPVLQVKHWRPLMFPSMLLLLPSTQPPLFVTPPIPLMLMLPQSRNAIGNINICSAW